MIEIDIPGQGTLRAAHVVFDYNGTIAVDGRIVEGAVQRINELAEQAEVHVLTADTYGSAAKECQRIKATLHTFPQAGAAACKKEIVENLKGGVICLGNGFNDQDMFQVADLAIAVLDGEGLYAGLLNSTDVLVRSCTEGLDLLLKPSHLRATLRS